MHIEEIMMLSPVIAVVAIEDPADAAPVTRALVAGGVRVVEITLRTPAALEAIAAAAGVDGAVVGAGTILTVQDLRQATAAGAAFAVSPGSTPALLEAGRSSLIPYLPGVATASELMAGLDAGYHRFKVFPAEAAGGLSLLKALAGPFPQARFCPTGGINPENAGAYLALPAVDCVGGSWIAPAGLITAKAWPAIEALAHKALKALV